MAHVTLAKQAKETEIGFGKVCKASNGSIGIVFGQGIDIHTSERIWLGVSLKGRTWMSKHPVLLAESLEQYTPEVTESKARRFDKTQFHVRVARAD